MTIERTLTIRRLRTGSVFRLVAAGVFCSVVPLFIFFGILSAFGLNAIRWNNVPVYGIRGLMSSPFMGLFVAAIFTAFAGIGMTFGLWIYSKIRPLKLQILEDDTNGAAT